MLVARRSIPRMYRSALHLTRMGSGWRRGRNGNGDGDGGDGGDGVDRPVRRAGNAFNKRQAAQEEQFFQKKLRDQLERLSKDDNVNTNELALHKEIRSHEEAIKFHQQALSRLRKK